MKKILWAMQDFWDGLVRGLNDPVLWLGVGLAVFYALILIFLFVPAS